ncbi:neutral zinc metallopeptidase [Frigidibacter sp.]|uniref:KPN_02809 family neutral zinc metallopeptidase n=1 Tax=Frigidibacter sp. TaxID=2586418 RepID=UPI002736D771|nr:neutral zinc metallopeptidase [Frigidibacter sp.]MDP3339944.1 neutral zinc metallopeptidase [Frigidibacter sp.]
MRWQGRRGSSNIEDRRKSGARMGGGGIQIGGLGLVAVVLIGWVLGVDVTPLLNGTTGGSGDGEWSQDGAELTEHDIQVGEFVSVTLADTEEVWTGIFAEAGGGYDPATLVLFKGVTQSPCGGASGATGPFYCPGDNKVYLDTAFFDTLEQQLGAKGDFAAAYVIAHEVAHHVQNELGILGEANQMRAQASEAQSNAISVRVELQADCFSGVFANHAGERFGSIEPGDIAEAMNAARQIGDDTLQRSSGRVPMPHTFTHGTSEQREDWFRRGYESGEIDACDTFSARNL